MQSGPRLELETAASAVAKRSSSSTRPAAENGAMDTAAQPVAAATQPWSVRSMVVLQRLAGNAAVVRLARSLGNTHVPLLVQRRIPAAAQVDPTTTAGATDQLQHVMGLELLNMRAMAQLSQANQAAVMTELGTRAGSLAAYGALPRDVQARMKADVLRVQHPTLVLGDPTLINIPPPPGSPAATNLATLVTNAGTLIGIVVSGARDNDLRDVFGAANVATAKARYNAALVRMNLLHSSNRIVTDRSGYNAEVGLGGLTNSNQIMVTANAMTTRTTTRASY